LFSYFETGHFLKEHGNISLEEYNAMLPWHLDANLSLMKRDAEQRRQDATNKQNSPF